MIYLNLFKTFQTFLFLFIYASLRIIISSYWFNTLFISTSNPGLSYLWVRVIILLLIIALLLSLVFLLLCITIVISLPKEPRIVQPSIRSTRKGKSFVTIENHLLTLVLKLNFLWSAKAGCTVLHSVARRCTALHSIAQRCKALQRRCALFSVSITQK